MVGLVLVSHSAQLAEAVKALAEQQTQGRAAIAAVGGTGDPESPFGTDAMAILEAIESVYQEDGVLMLMDLGSALMSTEMAIEFLEPERAGRIQMSAGPFVEGAMAAAVQASIGMDLQSVAREAAEAMGPKSEALGVAPAAERGKPLGAAMERGEARTEVSALVTLINHAGLHFGPAVLFVQTAAEYGADITVHNQTTDAGPVDAKRFNQVLSLGAEQGHQVEIRAWGKDARAAIDALVALAEAGFGEMEAPAALAVPEPSPPVIQGQGRLTLTGLAASPGVAIGTAVVVSDRDRAVPRFQVEDRAAEWDRYRAAVAQVQADL